jgi:hypothetical protein
MMKCAFGSKAETNMNGFAAAAEIKSLMSNDMRMTVCIG